jgi:hypothetical protein
VFFVVELPTFYFFGVGPGFMRAKGILRATGQQNALAGERMERFAGTPDLRTLCRAAAQERVKFPG